MENKRINDVGLKATTPRIKILKIMEHAKKRHLGADDVYRLLLDEGESIGLATVYRVLNHFEIAGLVFRNRFETGQDVFELQRGRRHDHLVCEKCGRVQEFYDEVIEAREVEVAKRDNFKITDRSLVIYGVCDRCSEND